MKQAIQSYGSGDVYVDDVPAPTVRPDGVLVATHYSVIADDLEPATFQFARKSFLGKARSRPHLVRKALSKARHEGVTEAIATIRSRLGQPFPLGRSCAGLVVDVGSSVTEFAVGDRVACAGLGCATHAETNFVPTPFCVRVPDGMEMASAAFAAAGDVAVQAVRQAEIAGDEVVGVVGLGLVGQLIAQLLKAMGSSVVGFDTDPAKVQAAVKLGCQNGMAEEGPGDTARPAVEAGLDALIVASVPAEGLVETTRTLCRANASLVVVPVPHEGLLASLSSGPQREARLSLVGDIDRYRPGPKGGEAGSAPGQAEWNRKRNMLAFLDRVSAGHVDTSALVTHRFPIAEAAEAYRLLDAQGGEPVGAILLSYLDRPMPEAPVRRVPVSAPAGGAAARHAAIGVLGAGHTAQRRLLAHLVRLPDVRLRAVAAVRGEVAKHAAREFGFEYCASDHVQVLDDPEVNVVFITLRPALHAGLVSSALAAGKHVFVAPPLCLNENELDEIVGAYQSQGGRCRLAVGFRRRFAPLVVELQQAFAGRRTPLAMLSRVNAEPSPRSKPAIRVPAVNEWIVGELSQQVDLLRFVAGAPDVHVTAVTNRPDAVSPDSLAATLAFDDGSIGTILYTSLGDTAQSKEHLEVFAGQQLGVLEDLQRLTLTHGGRTSHERARRGHDGYALEVQAFVESLLRDEPYAVSFEAACETTRTALRILAQARREPPSG